MRFCINDDNSIYNGAWTNWSNLQFKYPPLNIVEKEEEYLVEVELPGLKIEDINLKLEDHVLRISSKEENETKREKRKYVIRERVEKRFERTISLGSDVDEDKLTAIFKNGVLNILLPKKEQEKPKQIDVKIN